MPYYFSKEAISYSAKLIKKDLIKQHPSTKINHSYILNVIATKLGYKSHEDSITSQCMKTTIMSLNEINKLDTDIKSALSEFGIIENIKMLSNEKMSILKRFNENIYNYNIVEYMKMYEFLNNRKIYPKEIKTFDDCFEYSREFVKDIFQRYQEDYSYYLQNDKAYEKDLKDRDYIKYKEISMCKRKIQTGEELTPCDEILMNIAFRYNEVESGYYDAHIDDMEKAVKKEIIRVKSLLERKINYENFVKEVDDFYFYTPKKETKELIESYKKLLKENSIYLGQIPTKKSILSRNVEKHLNLFDKDRTNLLYVTGTCGSGSEEFLLSMVFEALIKKENVFYFDFYGSTFPALKISSLLSALGLNSKLIILSEEDLKILSKEKIKYYIRKNKIVLIMTKAQEMSSRKSTEEQIKKASFLIETVGKTQKNKRCNIYINDSNLLVNGDTEASKEFMEIINSGELEKYKNTKLILRGQICVFTYKMKYNSEFFKNCKDLIIMKSEGILPIELLNLNQVVPEIFSREIRNQNPGDFIFVKNHQVNENMPKLKSFFSNVYRVENISIDRNE